MQKQNKDKEINGVKDFTYGEQEMPEPMFVWDESEEQELQRVKDIQTSTIQILDFLYPRPNRLDSQLRLTRCLLGCLLENIQTYRPKEEQNFKTVIGILNELLQDMNDNSIKNQKEKLRALEELFYKDECKNTKYNNAAKTSQTREVSDVCMNMFRLFYEHNSINHQKQTVSCLIYEMIPLMNASFEDIESTISNQKTLDEFFTYKELSAALSHDRQMVVLYGLFEIAKELCPQGIPTQRSILLLSILREIKISSKWRADIPFKDIRASLMEDYKKLSVQMPEWAKQNDYTLANVANWLYQIVCASDVAQNAILHIAEKMLTYDGKVEISDTVTMSKHSNLKRFAF